MHTKSNTSALSALALIAAGKATDSSQECRRIALIAVGEASSSDHELCGTCQFKQLDAHGDSECCVDVFNPMACPAAAAEWQRGASGRTGIAA